TALSADIEAAPVTVTINKDYNGSTAVANNQMTVTGVAGQTLVLATGTATLTNPNVGSAALLTLNGASLSDGTGVATNYTLTSPNSVV
ncbi:hypothetical protein JZU68_04025, partial [bacterium]|nr:hypothetical protein [bacterium]